MKETSAENLQSVEPSDARFSLVMLLGLTTILAIVTAILGGVLRTVAVDTRHRLVTFGGIWLAGSIVITAIEMQQRRLAEQRAGRTILKIPLWLSANNETWLTWVIVARTLFYLLLIMPLSVLLVTGSPSTAGSDWLLFYAFPTIYPLMMMANIAPQLLWNHHVRFCENGILSDRKVLFWSDLLEHRFKDTLPSKLELKSTNDAHNRPWLTIKVEKDQVVCINKVIAEKTRSASKLPVITPVSLFQAPVREVFAYPHFRRHLPFVALSVAIGALLMYLGFVERPGNREFQDSLIFAVYVLPTAQVWRFRWVVRDSGVLIARGFGRRDLLGFVANASWALGLYWAIDRLVWPVWWIGYVAGTAFVFFSVNTAAYYFLTQLDFKPERAIIHGAIAWPWETVRIRRWDASRGKLVISRGWRWVNAYVPIDQTEAVDRHLRAKSLLE